MNLKRILKNLPPEPYIATDGYIPPRPPQVFFPEPPRMIVPTKGIEPIRLRESNLWYPAAKADFEGINICIWYDRTLRPMRGHKANCQWKFDGQIWWHL